VTFYGLRQKQKLGWLQTKEKKKIFFLPKKNFFFAVAVRQEAGFNVDP